VPSMSDYLDGNPVTCPRCGYETRTSSAACPNCYGPMPAPSAPTPKPAPPPEPVAAIEPAVDEAAAAQPTYEESPGFDSDNLDAPAEPEAVVEPSVAVGSPGPFTGFVLGDAPRIEIPQFDQPSPEATAEETSVAEQPVEDYQTFDLAVEPQAAVEPESAPVDIYDTSVPLEIPTDVAEAPVMAPIYTEPDELESAAQEESAYVEETPSEHSPFDLADLSAPFATEAAESSVMAPIYEEPDELGSVAQETPAYVEDAPTEATPFDFADLSAPFETEAVESPEIAPLYEEPVDLAPAIEETPAYVEDVLTEATPFDFADLSAPFETEAAEAPFDLSDSPMTLDTPAEVAPVEELAGFDFSPPVEPTTEPTQAAFDLGASEYAEAPIEPEPAYGPTTVEQQTPFDFGEFLPREPDDDAVAAEEAVVEKPETQQSFDSLDFSDLILPTYPSEEISEVMTADLAEHVAENDDGDALAPFDASSFAEAESLNPEAPAFAPVAEGSVAPAASDVSDLGVTPTVEALEIPAPTPEVEEPAAFAPIGFPAEEETPASTHHVIPPFTGETESVVDLGEMEMPEFTYPDVAQTAGVQSSFEPAEYTPYDLGTSEVAETPAPVEEHELEPETPEGPTPFDVGGFDMAPEADALGPTLQAEVIESEEPISFETFASMEETPVEEFAGMTLDEGLAREAPEIDEDPGPVTERPAPFDLGEDVAAETASAEPFDGVVEFAQEQPPFDLGDQAGVAEPLVEPESPVTSQEPTAEMDQMAEWNPDVAEAANIKGDETIAPRTSTEFVLEDEPSVEVAEFHLPEPLAPDLPTAAAAAAVAAASGSAAKVGLAANVAKSVGTACSGCAALVGRAIGGIGTVLKGRSKRTTGLISRYREARETEPAASPAPAAVVEEVRPIGKFEQGMLDRLASLEQVHAWADQLLQLNTETEAALGSLALSPDAQFGGVQREVGALRSAIADDVRQANDVKANPFSLYWTVWLKDERDVIATDLNSLIELIAASTDLDSLRQSLVELRNRYLAPDPAFYNHFGSLVLLYDLYPPKTVTDLARRSGAMRCGRALGQ
jgi:hypothetical protein